MTRQALRAMIVIGAAVVVAVMIFAELVARSGMGREGGSDRRDFYWTIVNSSDEPIFTVRKQGDRATGVIEPGNPALPEGNFIVAVPAGEDVQFGEGWAVVGDTPGGCFSGGDRWVVRSRSGDVETFLRGTPVDDVVEDLEVLWYIDSGMCTHQENLVWEYDGSVTASNSD